MSDDRDDEAAPTFSAFASVLRHDHTQPEGYAVEMDEGVERIELDGSPADPAEDVGPLVEVRLHLAGGRHVVHLMFDATEAHDLAKRLIVESGKARRA